jgi:hypothetical protein
MLRVTSSWDPTAPQRGRGPRAKRVGGTRARRGVYPAICREVMGRQLLFCVGPPRIL